jgi:hypothetical protein
VARRLLRGRRPRSRPEPGQCWSIGIYAGRSLGELTAIPDVINPVLTRAHVTDIPAMFVADPFMLKVGDIWHMFFEVLNGLTGRGEIGLAVSTDTKRWTYEGIVLNEPFHLSYPYVFQWHGEHFMIPETGKAKAVRLYRARSFPRDWTLIGELLRGANFLDSSVFPADGRWWMFTDTGPAPQFDIVRLFHADSLTGPWYEHPASPIHQGNPHIARPAGRVLRDGDRIIRLAQDCHPEYGLSVRAFEVVELTEGSYAERLAWPNPIVGPTGTGWNAGGMHHVDAHRESAARWLACVDGWAPMGPRS